jgi:5-methylcytosine-specific restriction endonuclease McrA
MDLSKEFYPVPKNKRVVNKKLLKDKNGRCEICGRFGQTEKHHKKTKGSGGNDTEDNLIEVCRMCHTKIHQGIIKLDKNTRG